VHAGKIHEVDGAVVGDFDAADVLLDGDAGVVGDLLTEAGQTIEEGRLAGVGRPDEGDERRVVSIIE
jgi:hypothetical protein